MPSSTNEPAPTLPSLDDLLAHADWLRRLAFRLVRDDAYADDAAQETIYAALRSPPDPRRPLRPWLAQVLRNTVRLRARRDGRRGAREQVAFEARASVPTPEELIVHLEQQRVLSSVVMELEEPYRSTILLRFYEARSAEEISRALGVPAGTVRWRTQEALARLRRLLDERHGGDRRVWIAAFLPTLPVTLPARQRQRTFSRGASLAVGALLTVFIAVVAAHWHGAVEPRPDRRARSQLARFMTALGRYASATGATKDDTSQPVPTGRTIVVRGVVQDAGGGSIAGALISLSLAEQLDAPARQFQTRADENGRYQLGLPAGSYEVVVSSEGYVSSRTPLQLGAPYTRDFRLEPGARIIGRVRAADGRPVTGAEVRAEALSRENLGSPPATRTNGRGEFTLGELPAGIYRVVGRLGDDIGAASSNVSVEVAGLAGDIDVLLGPGAALDGIVQGPSGQRLANARLELRPRQLFGSSSSAENVWSALDGTFRFTGLRPGEYEVTAHAPRHVEARITALVDDRATAHRTLILAPAASARGFVLGPDGTPAAGVLVAAQVRRPTGGWSYDRARTDEQGRFYLERLAPGPLVITARGPSGVASEGPLELSAASVPSVTMRLSPGHYVSGQVRWDDGAPASYSAVHAQTESPGYLAADPVFADRHGRFTTRPLLTGRALIVAVSPEEHPGFAGRSRPDEAVVDLSPGDSSATVSLVVARRESRLMGIVIAPDGRPKAGSVVTAVRSDVSDTSPRTFGRGFGSGISATDGTFVIERLRRGRYTLTATHPDYAPAKATGIQADGNDVELALRRAGDLDGVVVTSAGQPVPRYDLLVLDAPPGIDTVRRFWKRFIKPERPKEEGRSTDGAFSLHALAQGRYDLVALLPDGGLARANGILVDGSRGPRVRLVVEKGRSVTGVVLNESGAPVPEVEVRVAMPDRFLVRAVSGPDGRFQLDEVPQLPGLVVEVAPPGGYDHDFIRLPAGAGAADLGTVSLRHPGPQARFGFSIADTDPALTVEVDAGSLAAGAGLRTGDAVVALNGVDVESVSFQGLIAVMASSRRDSGGALTLRVKGGDHRAREVTIRNPP